MLSINSIDNHLVPDKDFEGTRRVVLMKCKVIFDLIKSNNSKIIDQARLALIILNFHPACDPTVYS